MFINIEKQIRNVRRLLEKKAHEYSRLFIVNQFSYECKRCYLDVVSLSGCIEKLEAQNDGER